MNFRYKHPEQYADNLLRHTYIHAGSDAKAESKEKLNYATLSLVVRTF